jgi:hypothetical protein
VDAGDSLTYAITAGNSGGAFTIDPQTGELRVANPAALDFETFSAFSLTVEVTDSGGLTHAASVTVHLADVYEPPPFDPQEPPAPGEPDDEPPPYPFLDPGTSDATHSDALTPPSADESEDSDDSRDENLDLALPQTLAEQSAGGRPAGAAAASEIAAPQAPVLLASAALTENEGPQDVFLVLVDAQGLRALSDRPPLLQPGQVGSSKPGDPRPLNLPAMPFDSLALGHNLDQFADEMQQQAEEQQAFEMLVAGSTAVVTTGLTVGYLVWALRGGSLLATMISSLPAWTLIDPLPILNRIDPRPENDRPGVDDSLSAIAAGGRSDLSDLSDLAGGTR